MKFEEVIAEERGSGSFDYKYWFWSKKSSTYGFGYARQDIQLDIAKKGEEAADAAKNIESILAVLKKKPEDDPEDLQIVERKVKANTKRLKGIVDLFHSPIVLYWLNGDKPTPIEIPTSMPGDVEDSNGTHIDVVDLFSDKRTSEFVTAVMDLNKLVITDDYDTLNTLTAKFLKYLFGEDRSAKSIRSLARGTGLESVMSDIYFKKNGIEVKSFERPDYKLLGAGLRGSKKVVSNINKMIEDNFQNLLKTARSRLG